MKYKVDHIEKNKLWKNLYNNNSFYLDNFFKKYNITTLNRSTLSYFKKKLCYINISIFNFLIDLKFDFAKQLDIDIDSKITIRHWSKEELAISIKDPIHMVIDRGLSNLSENLTDIFINQYSDKYLNKDCQRLIRKETQRNHYYNYYRIVNEDSYLDIRCNVEFSIRFIYNKKLYFNALKVRRNKMKHENLDSRIRKDYEEEQINEEEEYTKKQYERDIKELEKCMENADKKIKDERFNKVLDFFNMNKGYFIYHEVYRKIFDKKIEELKEFVKDYLDEDEKISIEVKKNTSEFVNYEKKDSCGGGQCHG